MDTIVFLEKVDSHGIVSVPKELRELYMIEDAVEIIAIREGILIKNPDHFLLIKDRFQP